MLLQNVKKYNEDVVDSADVNLVNKNRKTNFT